MIYSGPGGELYMKKPEAKKFDTLSLLAIWTATKIHNKLTT
jgi:hypothetical protein